MDDIQVNTIQKTATDGKWTGPTLSISCGMDESFKGEILWNRMHTCGKSDLWVEKIPTTKLWEQKMTKLSTAGQSLGQRNQPKLLCNFQYIVKLNKVQLIDVVV